MEGGEGGFATRSMLEAVFIRGGAAIGCDGFGTASAIEGVEVNGGGFTTPS